MLLISSNTSGGNCLMQFNFMPAVAPSGNRIIKRNNSGLRLTTSFCARLVNSHCESVFSISLCLSLQPANFFVACL